MILQLIKTFSDLIMPPPTAVEEMRKAFEAEKWGILNTHAGRTLLENERAFLKVINRPTSKEWENFCILMSDQWKQAGFKFRANYWMGMIKKPPKNKKQSPPPSNAKTVPPEQWEVVNKEDPKYHNKAELTGEEIELIGEKGLDLEKAACIKFVMKQGYDISRDGYSNTTLASKLTSKYGKGYGKDTVKGYAAVLRAAKSEKNPSLLEW